MNRTALVTLATASLIALAACSTPGNTTTKAADVGAAPSSTASAAPAAAAFGDSVKFPSGVSVVVTATSSTAGQYASGAVDGKIVNVSIKITNGSGKQINGAMMSVPKVTYGAAGTQAKSAVDTGHTMAMVSTVLPGETQTGGESFGIPTADYGNVRVEVSGPEFTDSPAVFKGAVQ